MQRYRVTLEHRNLAPSTINQHLSAIRALCDECAESGLLDQPTAAAIGRVKGVPVRGVRIGNWLTRDQAEKLLRGRLGSTGNVCGAQFAGGAHGSRRRTRSSAARSTSSVR